MLRLEWNALRVGDRVLVHDTTKGGDTLAPGTVAMITMQRSSNGVGIRISRAGAGYILWPSELAVHHDPRSPDRPCWRCQTIMEAAA